MKTDGSSGSDRRLMLTRINTRPVFWPDQTLSALRLGRLEACEKELADLGGHGLFDAETTDTDAERLFSQSWYAEEEKKPRLHSIEEMRNHLLSITDNTINKKIETGRKVAYTPLSQSICNCDWDIVRNFLDTNKYPNLDLNIPNTNNTCPIQELLTKYKSDVFSSVCGDPRCLNKKLPGNEDERVRLFTEVLDRTDKRTLFTKSNHRKISVLQEALETFDMRYIKPIVDKMTDGGKSKFPDDFHISADELSPLYYAVELKFRLNTDPRKEFKKMKESHNIRWANFAVPGMTERS